MSSNQLSMRDLFSQRKRRVLPEAKESEEAAKRRKVTPVESVQSRSSLRLMLREQLKKNKNEKINIPEVILNKKINREVNVEEKKQDEVKLEQKEELSRPLDEYGHPLHDYSLPDNYMFLEKIFQAVETTISFHIMMGKPCPFENVKEGVEQVLHRRFEKKHLAQILSVYPEAYEILVDNEKLLLCAKTDKKLEVKTGQKIRPGVGKLKGMPHVRRLWEFRRRLVERVRTCHDVFISGLERFIPSKDISKVSGWHRDFVLSDVSDVDEAHLPETQRQSKFSRGEFAKNVAKQFDHINSPAIRKALQHKFLRSHEEVDHCAPSPSKYVSDKLFTKVQRREEHAEFVKQSGISEKLQRRTKVSQLPSLLDSIRAIMSNPRRSSMLVVTLAEKLKESKFCVSDLGELRSLIELLTTLAPDICSLVDSRMGRCLQINWSKSESISRIKQRLKDFAQAQGNGVLN